MLGQYRVLNEILIFAVGVAITSYVALSFSGVKDIIGLVSTTDKLDNTANNILNAIVRASEANSSLVIEIPETISEKAYMIRVLDGNGGACDKGDDCFLNLSTTDVSIAKQLFNISQNYNIKGDVHSTARFLTISSDKSTEQIVLGRA